jgi:pimeloyl-ACP methyl ester carboxylesterase
MRAAARYGALAVLLLACGGGGSATPGAPDASLDGRKDATSQPDGPADSATTEADSAPSDAGHDATTDAFQADAPVVVGDGAAEGGPFEAGAVDAGICAMPIDCTAANAATTCAGGVCVDSLCYPMVVNPHQWDLCGNGACDVCEDAVSCPADCATPPVVTGTPVYDDPNTMTVFIHGFSNSPASTRAAQTYGVATPCGILGALASEFGQASRPCGDTTPTAPNQLVGVEYYGGVAPSWMSAADVAEINQYAATGGPTGLQRYARVVAKFIRYQMSLSGSTHVNLVCHSMGCLLSRYVIENDLEQLASTATISRWVGCAGVVAGAQLARLFSISPAIQAAADALGLSVDDFAAMNPDYVQEFAASYDHKLWSADSPLYAGILMHHMGATNPAVPQGGNIQLLNLNNPTYAPNDGIMFTLDEFYATTGPLALFKTPSSVTLPTTHSFNYVGHIDAPSNIGFQAIAAAGLWSKRKVIVTLSSLQLQNDREYHLPDNPTEQGTPPAEISVETQVAYDPYTMPTFGQTALVQDDEIAYSSPSLYTQTAGTTDTRGVVLFEGPIFDGQTSFQLTATINEVDLYPRWSVNEALLNTPNRPLAAYSGLVTVSDQMLSGGGLSTTYANAVITVQVVDMY